MVERQRPLTFDAADGQGRAEMIRKVYEVNFLLS
jgi:hypothetical protein